MEIEIKRGEGESRERKGEREGGQGERVEEVRRGAMGRSLGVRIVL